MEQNENEIKGKNCLSYHLLFTKVTKKNSSV